MHRATNWSVQIENERFADKVCCMYSQRDKREREMIMMRK